MIKKVVILLGLVFGAGIVFVWGIHTWADKPMQLRKATVIEVANGDNLYQLINTLNRQGILECKSCAQWFLRLSLDRFSNIIPGEYKLPANISFQQFLLLLKQKKTLQYKVTIVEGWTLRQALAAIWGKEKLKRTLRTDQPQAIFQELAFLNAYSHQGHAEGLFFPATYTFNKGMSDVDVLKQAHEKLQAVLTQEWENKAPGLPYKNAYEALIMASIIEKETGVSGERDEVAGVFVRRLKKGMLLQTDPTVIYGMGERFQGDIRRRDLREKTDYNTYVNLGLPPTPIALPGRESIHAALHPASGDSLYFVADGKGGHVFSKTLAQHNRAVRKYLRMQRQMRQQK